ncbi:MAG TPA: glycosyltransferase family 39 protein [Ktedonobacteraceae bacterium]
MQTNTTSKHAEYVPFPNSTLFKKSYPKFLRTQNRPLDLVLLLMLTLSALLPRILLARQLDVVTDETVYILGAKIYFQQATHLAFRSSAWDYNYEHPALVKLCIGLVLFLNAHLGHLFPELFAARIPSILCGTLLVLAIYVLGKSPFGRAIAFPAALCLAFSPWLTYFSALAYLDTPMTMFIALAFLLVWYAPRYPWLYPLIAACIALGAACKYPAALALPGLVAYILYVYLVQRRSLPVAERPAIPWRWWLATCIVLPLVFLLVDPAIWRSPVRLLLHSLDFEWNHASEGHSFFLNGHVYFHVPFWTILFITLAKMSLFVTVPAAGFLLLMLFRLISPLKKSRETRKPIEPQAILLFCWLLGILIPFSQLTIVVGTHYELPVATPTALAAAYSLSMLITFLQRKRTDARHDVQRGEMSAEPQIAPGGLRIRWQGSLLLQIFLLCIVLAGPHLWGLLTNTAAEGYTSELFQGENRILQVAYPGYREGALWLAQHTQGPANVGLVALVNTLPHSPDGVNWYSYNASLPARLSFSEAHPGAPTYSSYTYLIWPMHLVQRGYPLPPPRSMHIVHIITGGQTIYCYILARSTVSISQ